LSKRISRLVAAAKRMGDDSRSQSLDFMEYVLSTIRKLPDDYVIERKLAREFGEIVEPRTDEIIQSLREQLERENLERKPIPTRTDKHEAPLHEEPLHEEPLPEEPLLDELEIEQDSVPEESEQNNPALGIAKAIAAALEKWDSPAKAAPKPPAPDIWTFERAVERANDLRLRSSSEDGDFFVISDSEEDDVEYDPLNEPVTEQLLIARPISADDPSLRGVTILRARVVSYGPLNGHNTADSAESDISDGESMDQRTDDYEFMDQTEVDYYASMDQRIDDPQPDDDWKDRTSDKRRISSVIFLHKRHKKMTYVESLCLQREKDNARYSANSTKAAQDHRRMKENVRGEDTMRLSPVVPRKMKKKRKRDES